LVIINYDFGQHSFLAFIVTGIFLEHNLQLGTNQLASKTIIPRTENTTAKSVMPIIAILQSGANACSILYIVSFDIQIFF
jgi:hypothetical protein